MSALVNWLRSLREGVAITLVGAGVISGLLAFPALIVLTLLGYFWAGGVLCIIGLWGGGGLINLADWIGGPLDGSSD
jgi:hypothetical protein